MCSRHDSNERYHGRPVPRKDQPLGVRIREVGWTVTESGCWEWKGKRNDQDYGIFNARRLGLEGARAHRVVYVAQTGNELPDDMELCHRCDNPPCVNPSHMFIGTHADNMTDMTIKGRRGMYRVGGVCKNGHDVTRPGTTEVVRRVGRPDEEACIACRNARIRRYKDRVRGRSSPM
jgi:hypothetical protein